MHRDPKKAPSSTNPDAAKHMRLQLAERRLRALDRALACNPPTADIEDMLADIERGRDLR